VQLRRRSVDQPKEDAMAHHYQLMGGSLMVIKYSNLTDIQFSFYVYDQDSKSAAYCWYGSDTADKDKFGEADLNNKFFKHQAGVGNQIGSVLLEKPLNFKQLERTKCFFTLTGHGATDKGVATLFRDKAPLIHLSFPILADFDLTDARAKSSGQITQVKIEKTSVPKLPARYHDFSKNP
jgi:hypothetical protein